SRGRYFECAATLYMAIGGKIAKRGAWRDCLWSCLRSSRNKTSELRVDIGPNRHKAHRRDILRLDAWLPRGITPTFEFHGKRSRTVWIESRMAAHISLSGQFELRLHNQLRRGSLHRAWRSGH